MASINKVILIGRVGKEPAFRQTQGGHDVATLSLATSRYYKDSNGQRVEETEWHLVVLFGKMAEIANNYVRKGSQLYIEGRLQTRKYTDKQGVERYQTQIIAETMQFVGDKKEGATGNQQQPAQRDSEDVPF